MRPQIEAALPAHALNGETPVRSEREEVLQWVDMGAPRLHHFAFDDGRCDRRRRFSAGAPAAVAKKRRENRRVA